MAVVTTTGLNGTYFTGQSRSRRAGGPDGIGLSKRIIQGTGASASVGSPANLSPLIFLPDTMAAFADLWSSSFDRSSFIQYATNDGAVGGKWFTNLTNSGTAVATATTTGFEGMITSTCGTTSGNTNSWIGTEGWLPLTNRIGWCTIRLNLPAEATASLYDIWFGWTNKPGTASPPSTVVDGAWFTGIGTNGVLTVNLNSTKNSVAATPTVLSPTIVATSSIELGVIHQGQVGTDFYWRVPTTAPTFVAGDNWKFAGSLSAAANLPRNTAVLRPYFAHIARSTAASAITVESMKYGFEHAVVY